MPDPHLDPADRQDRDGDVVTLGMVLEEKPTARHAERTAEHREALEPLIGVSQVVLGSHPTGDPDRAGMGFSLIFFAGELASVLAFGELGADGADPASDANQCRALRRPRTGGCAPSGS